MAHSVPTSRKRDLSLLKLAELSVDDVVYCHLSQGPGEQLKGHLLYSSLQDIEEEMRQSRGLQVTSRYVPILAAFSILEQIGDIYRDTSIAKHPKSGGGIEHALYYFGGLPAMSPEVKALYALRNGLVHAASLTSTDQGTGARYIFRYDYQMLEVIKPASQAWDGQISTVNSSVITRVNPRALTDLVSAALDQVRSLFFDRPSSLRVQRNAGHILVNHLFW